VATITASTQVAGSQVRITYTLQAGQPWLQIDIWTRWVEVGNPGVGIPKLAMRLPLALTGAKATYEIPFGSIQRDECSGQEVPGLRWADVNGRLAGAAGRAAPKAGCALLNDCKYGHSLNGSTLRLTLIRSSYDPDPMPEVGDHNIRLALVPHGKPLATAELTRLAAALNEPLQVINTDVHEGPLPAVAAIAGAAPANVILSSIKRAEDDECLIVRLYETAGKDTQAKVRLDPQLLGQVARAQEVDFLERPTPESSAKAAKDGFAVRLPAHGIASVKVTLTR
jgi:alpha-mannosidase